ncbi:hypothetical protein EVAR_63973_1 [Eumeta japonica]|uniref:Uncharacterized protein n=1 Tax=Eumeta variegata TaxID=151549 RepID=A0A4C1ZHV4_EUMVA|nr:hypothetical protein EVAR_63973_1 [Eumeta japonica]
MAQQNNFTDRQQETKVDCRASGAGRASDAPRRPAPEINISVGVVSIHRGFTRRQQLRSDLCRAAGRRVLHPPVGGAESDIGRSRPQPKGHKSRTAIASAVPDAARRALHS